VFVSATMCPEFQVTFRHRPRSFVAPKELLCQPDGVTRAPRPLGDHFPEERPLRRPPPLGSEAQLVDGFGLPPCRPNRPRAHLRLASLPQRAAYAAAYAPQVRFWNRDGFHVGAPVQRGLLRAMPAPAPCQHGSRRRTPPRCVVPPR
jgi:hypothetical protein